MIINTYSNGWNKIFHLCWNFGMAQTRSRPGKQWYDINRRNRPKPSLVARYGNRSRLNPSLAQRFIAKVAPGLAISTQSRTSEIHFSCLSVLKLNIGSLSIKLEVSYVWILTFNIFDILHWHLLLFCKRKATLLLFRLRFEIHNHTRYYLQR